jgi:hypothetical protein
VQFDAVAFQEKYFNAAGFAHTSIFTFQCSAAGSKVWN